MLCTWTGFLSANASLIEHLEVKLEVTHSGQVGACAYIEGFWKLEVNNFFRLIDHFFPALKTLHVVVENFGAPPSDDFRGYWVADGQLLASDREDFHFQALLNVERMMQRGRILLMTVAAKTSRPLAKTVTFLQTPDATSREALEIDGTEVFVDAGALDGVTHDKICLGGSVDASFCPRGTSVVLP